MGTVAALEGARAATAVSARKFVYAASSTCYGLAATPTREDHPIDPKYPYALSKNMGEQAAFHWHQLYGLAVNSIRIFNAYGTRSRTTGAYGAVFGVFLKQKLASQPYTLSATANGATSFTSATWHGRRPPPTPSPVRRLMSAPATRNRSTAWWRFWAARKPIFPSAPAARLHLGRHRQNHRSAWLAAGNQLCRRRRADDMIIGPKRRFGRRRISSARPRPGSATSAARVRTRRAWPAR